MTTLIGAAFGRSQERLPMHQFGVQDRGAGGTADRVVAERDELVVEHRTRTQATYRHGHAAVATRVERRLGPILFGEIDERLRRRRRQPELLRSAAERIPGGDDRFGVGLL